MLHLSSLRLRSLRVRPLLAGATALLAAGLSWGQANYSSPYAITTLAGGAGFSGFSDDTGTDARFNTPYGVALGSGGILYVADERNFVIRKVTASGVVTTFVGQPGVSGTADGTGSAAQFGPIAGIVIDPAGNLYVTDWISMGATTGSVRKVSPAGVVTTLVPAGTLNRPVGIAIDSSNALYVADSGNNVIRKVTSGGAVSVFAGTVGSNGFTEGGPGTGLLGTPTGVAVDSSGNVYVADNQYSTIRKITATGVLSTYAGAPGAPGVVDGAAGGARFSHPVGLAIDRVSNLYVSDATTMIRQVSASGTVSSLAGAPFRLGSLDFTGGQATFNNPAGIAVDNSFTIYIADSGNMVIRKGVPTVVNQPPQIQSPPQGLTAPAGANVAMGVIAAGVGLTYQWQFNGVAIPGATDSNLSLINIDATQAGVYTVVVTNPYGAVTSAPATVAVQITSHLANISSRAFVGTGGDILIAGFVTSGPSQKQILLRGVGPTLGTFGVPGTLANPQLGLFRAGESAAFTSNASWGGSQTLANAFAQVGAFALPAGSSDDALLLSLPAGGYSAQVSGANSTTGVALAEIYDADTAPSAARLVNISSRASVGTGGNILFAGFVITGTTSETILIRGIGPALLGFGLGNALTAPQLTLFDKDGVQVATNVGWTNAPVLGPSQVLASVRPASLAVMRQVGAFDFPANSADCAMLVNLPPGLYSAQVSGVNSTTGVGMVEVYDVR